MSLNAIYINGQTSAYLICALVISARLYSTTNEGVFLYLTSIALFISGLIIFISKNPSLLYGSIVNATVVTIFAYILSTVNFKNFYKDFINNKEIIKKRSELEEINKKLIEHEKLRGDFFANISHELRTPINVIYSAEQVMELNLKKSQGYDMSKYLKMVKQNSFRLIRIISNLIDITKIDALSFDVKFRNLNIVKIVEDITISVAEFIENKGLTVIFDTSIEEKVIACDPDLIERIMLNLLSNSVKFTKRGGSILVSIYLEEDKVCISVKDSGIGIPDNMKEIIFDRFIQVDKSTTKNCEGSGIGLSLVKSLVEIHKGTISLNSVISKGSEFIIYLPDELCFKEDVHENIINLEDSRIEKINIEFSDIYN
ncbi:HAMP domain-containing histidine kinase [Clostridium intestinale]|uniref:histidine kinase n=2 Tax=Clostridium intestinale TaxID=36845 RepID=A0A7D6VUM3_9CLOT|nr:HAMP domain-containing histidine kinase [Clostridium intestinale]